MDSYPDLFRRVIDDLEASRHVELVRADVTDGTDAGYVTKILAARGWTASPAYVAFYAAVDEVHIEWRLRPDAVARLGLENNMGVTGRIDIASFETVIAGLASPDYWFRIAWDAFVETAPEECRLVPFDFFDNDTSGCACVDRVGTTIGETLTYFDHGFGTAPLAPTIAAYCQQLTRTRGIYGWQRASLGTGTTHHRDVHAALKRIFGAAR